MNDIGHNNEMFNSGSFKMEYNEKEIKDSI